MGWIFKSAKKCNRLEIGDAYDCSVVNYLEKAPDGIYYVIKANDRFEIGVAVQEPKGEIPCPNKTEKIQNSQTVITKPRPNEKKQFSKKKQKKSIKAR